MLEWSCRPGRETGARIETPPEADSRNRSMCRPGRETGARIETIPQADVNGVIICRPGRETGARIETESFPPRRPVDARRPGRETGARIETSPRHSGKSRRSVAPVARPGRGLKLINKVGHATAAASPRSRDRGAD